LDLPGGIRFHTIEARTRLQDLTKLLAACSSTLEVLSIRCFDNGEFSTIIPKYQSTEGRSADG